MTRRPLHAVRALALTTMLGTMAVVGCAVSAEAPVASESQSVVRVDGDVVLHGTRVSPTELHAEVLTKDGRKLFEATYLVGATDDTLSWKLATPEGEEPGSAKGPTDSSVLTMSLDSFLPSIKLLFEQQNRRLSKTNYDNKGCDAFISSTGNDGKCCDYHDDCFSANDCTQWSWVANVLLGPLLSSLSACARCNNNVVACAAGSSLGPSTCVTCGDCGQAWPNKHGNGNTYSNGIAAKRASSVMKCDGSAVVGGNCCPVGGWDGAHCYTGAVPAGSAGGFVYNSQLYYQPVKAVGYCPQAGSWWDGANCHLPNIPAGTTPFIYNGNPYYSYAPGSVRCPVSGSWDDGANCQVSKPQLGMPFVYAGQLYYWMPSCPVSGSWFDGANCKMPDIPANRGPFIWNNGMYYSCQ